jgi:glycosyltransferase involved in cell wall biosynthesis
MNLVWWSLFLLPRLQTIDPLSTAIRCDLRRKTKRMRILLDHQLPFLLAHGGLQIQIERTKQALEIAGVEVEYLRWWDDSHRGDIIHFFGRANPSHIDFAHAKGMKYVMSELLTGQGSRTRTQLRVQSMIEKALRAVVPPTFLANFRWDAYHKADACIFLTEWEAEVARLLFSPPPHQLHVVPNGVEPEFFLSASATPSRGDELVCTATITERKRVLELAEAAVAARVPVRVLGSPYGKDDPYYLRFLALAERHSDFVRYTGPVNDRAELARIYQSARGFVLLSTMESLSLSALEAAASGCPLLLSDLPWARCTFGRTTSYCPIGSPRSTAACLRDFYDKAPRLPRPDMPSRWKDVARQLVEIYRKL